MAKMTQDQLVQQLQLAFGAELQAVVLYGSSARDAHDPRKPRHNVLVVVARLTVDTLAREAAVAQAWMDAGHPPLLTMTAGEWAGSADIFPIEYADLLDSHRVLHGTLRLDGVRVEKRDLRLQLEHEAMGKLLRLRRGILAAGDDSRRRLALLEESIGAFLVLFRALLRLHGDAVPRDDAAVIVSAAARAGFEAEPFLVAQRHARGTAKLARGGASALLAGYLAGATQLVQHIDHLGAQ
jgi:hypothetical protein